jgi:hypothetical protein
MIMTMNSKTPRITDGQSLVEEWGHVAGRITEEITRWQKMNEYLARVRSNKEVIIMRNRERGDPNVWKSWDGETYYRRAEDLDNELNTPVSDVQWDACKRFLTELYGSGCYFAGSHVTDPGRDDADAKHTTLLCCLTENDEEFELAVWGQFGLESDFLHDHVDTVPNRGA